MFTFLPALRIATVAAAFLSLLGATRPSVTSMYLRMPNLSAAPTVSKLVYDAVATVPAKPMTPAALLPRDQVEGSMIVRYGTTGRRVDRSDFKGVTNFTVVAVNDDGNVVMRTAFTGITITSVELVPTGDGNMARRVKFIANSVKVTSPETT